MVKEILDLATKLYPNDTSILEMKINQLIKTDKPSVYELFKKNKNKVSPNIWLLMVEHFSNEPRIIEDIFDMVFGDKSNCENEIKQKLGNEYLKWLSKNKTLNDARNIYTKLITNSGCDESLCKTLVTIETEQDKVDVTKIRQHFTLACMQFGKTNIG